MIAWLKNNKYKVATGVLVLLVLFMQYRSMVKDFTHEKAMMQIQFRDEKNELEQKLRAELNEAKVKKIEAIRVKELQDSMVAINTHILDNTIRALQSQKYNYETYKAFDNFGSDDLRSYYSKLPKHNDYSR
jgi:uncharacterized protein YaaW (UPF0174 family)